MRLNFRSSEEDLPVEVRPDGKDWTVRIADAEFPLQALQARDGSWLVDTHQGRRRLWVSVHGDERLVFCDGRVHRLRVPDPEQGEETEDPGSGPNLVAEMPGKIVKTLVAAGESVEAGQALVLIESMKMETELLAPVNGRVDTVHVTDGQLVAQGDALVDIQPAEES